MVDDSASPRRLMARYIRVVPDIDLSWIRFVLEHRELEYRVLPCFSVEGRPPGYPAHRGFRGKRTEQWSVVVRARGSDSPGCAGSYPRSLDVGLEQAMEVSRIFWDRL